MVSGETKICPVCDSTISAGARECPECNADLSLFEVDRDGITDIDAVPTPKDGKSIDDILASILKDKEVRPKFFEDIKTIASGTPDEDILADAEVEPGVEFQCPNCGTRVASTAKVCPGCGAQFAEETVEQFECPLCGAVVDIEATSCPNCGVTFVQEEAPSAPKPEPVVAPPPVPKAVPSLAIPAAPSEGMERAAPTPAPKPAASSSVVRLRALVEARRIAPQEEILDKAVLYKELPRLVNEVKPLLLTAKKIGMEIGEEKRLLSEAIAHGKRRNVEESVLLIRRARFRLQQAFTSEFAERIEALLTDAEPTWVTGTDVGAIVKLCTAAIEALEAGDYATAADKMRAAREEFDARSGGSSRARQELETVRAIAADAKKLGLNLREVEGRLSEGDAALRSRNYDRAAGLAVQARQALLKALHDALSKEMKKARNALLEMKVKGGDLTKPVGILKQASIHMKREEYADAIRFVRMFRDEVASV